MRNKKTNYFSAKQMPFVGAAVALVLIAGIGFFISRSAAQKDLQATQSHAGEITNNHWPHATVPFSLTLMNSMSAVWKPNVLSAVTDWHQAQVVRFRQVVGPAKETCDFLPEMINLCVFQDANTGWIAYGQYISYNKHIVAANAGFNDAYFNNKKSEFSTPVWRNRMVCGYIGWLLGEEWLPGKPGNPLSCMEGGSSFDTVDKQQHPTLEDLSLLKLIYGHKDDNSSTSVSSTLPVYSSVKNASSWGERIPVVSDGHLELYKQDLGSGYTMVTLGYRK